MPKVVNVGYFKNLKVAVKQCYQIGQFQLDKNYWKMPKLKNQSATFLLIFKHCGFLVKCAYIRLGEIEKFKVDAV